MTRVRHLVLPAACVLLFPAGCAERSPSGAPPSVPLQPMAPVPGPYPGSGPLEGDLSPGELGVDPIPYERFAFTERLHALAGDSPDLGVIDATERTVLVVRWFGEPPAEVRALIREFADAPFDIRVEHTRFRFGELRAEAHRLIGEHPAVVTTTFPRVEDGPRARLGPGAGRLIRVAHPAR